MRLRPAASNTQVWQGAKPSPPWLGVYLAVSFHSASSPSLRQISSSSVNRAWGMCSSSPSSVPNRNCTLWAGVSAAASGTRGGTVDYYRANSADCKIKRPMVALLVLLGLTVGGGFSTIVSCGVPLLGPLSVSVPMVTVASVWPPAQGDMNPNVEGAVAWRQQAEDTITFSSLSNESLRFNELLCPRGSFNRAVFKRKRKNKQPPPPNA